MFGSCYFWSFNSYSWANFRNLAVVCLNSGFFSNIFWISLSSSSIYLCWFSTRPLIKFLNDFFLFENNLVFWEVSCLSSLRSSTSLDCWVDPLSIPIFSSLGKMWSAWLALVFLTSLLVLRFNRLFSSESCSLIIYLNSWVLDAMPLLLIWSKALSSNSSRKSLLNSWIWVFKSWSSL